MKKILSIILALGLVLSMSLAAMPAAAQTTPVGCGTVVPDDDCAGATATYTITFTSPVTLLAGNDILSFSFGAGTTFATPAGAVNIDGPNMVGPIAVPPATVVRAAPDIQFVLPAGAYIAAGDSVVVTIAGVKNPAAGKTSMKLGYKFACCDPVMFCSAEYTIKPAKSTYKYVIDFGPTYAGIAEDFIPPFQACGQDTSPLFPGVGHVTLFDITLTFDVEGCEGYNPVYNKFELISAPPGGTATLAFWDVPNGGSWDIPAANYALEIDPDDEELAKGMFPPVGFPLAANHVALTHGWIHFDTVGEYVITLCLEYEIPAGECEEIGTKICLAEKTITAVVHQWKTAYQITLFPKWNLISLPIVPFETDLDAALESFASPELVLGIYQYDTLAGEYDAYPGFGLDEMVDGKGYWMKMAYGGTNPPAGTPTVPAGPIGTWWVWGTDRPGDPPTPVSYDAFEGWNQIGFTSTTSAADTAYLSNWLSYWGIYGYGNIYGWVANTQTYLVQTPGAATLNPGMGYWVNFHYDGEIYF